MVDTPGIREFGLSGLVPDDLLRFYPDIAFVGQGCRFPDCTHLGEADCAVRVAVRNDALSPMRYDNYKKIRRSLDS